MRRTFIPHLFESMSSPTTKLGGFKSRASVGVTGGRPSVPHHWGQRSTWVFRFLGNAPFVPRQKIPLSKFSPRMKRLKPDFNRAQRDSRVFLFFFFSNWPTTSYSRIIRSISISWRKTFFDFLGGFSRVASLTLRNLSCASIIE